MQLFWFTHLGEWLLDAVALVSPHLCGWLQHQICELVVEHLKHATSMDFGFIEDSKKDSPKQRSLKVYMANPTIYLSRITLLVNSFVLNAWLWIGTGWLILPKHRMHASNILQLFNYVPNINKLADNFLAHTYSASTPNQSSYAVPLGASLLISSMLPLEPFRLNSPKIFPPLLLLANSVVVKWQGTLHSTLILILPQSLPLMANWLNTFSLTHKYCCLSMVYKLVSAPGCILHSSLFHWKSCLFPTEWGYDSSRGGLDQTQLALLHEIVYLVSVESIWTLLAIVPICKLRHVGSTPVLTFRWCSPSSCVATKSENPWKASRHCNVLLQSVPW